MGVRAQQGALGIVVGASADRKLPTETCNGILLPKSADQLGLLRIGQFPAIGAWVFFSSSTVWARMSLSISSVALAFSSSMQRRLSSSIPSGQVVRFGFLCRHELSFTRSFRQLSGAACLPADTVDGGDRHPIAVREASRALALGLASGDGALL